MRTVTVSCGPQQRESPAAPPCQSRRGVLGCWLPSRWPMTRKRVQDPRGARGKTAGRGHRGWGRRGGVSTRTLLCLEALNFFFHTSSPAVPRASPAPTRPRGEEPCPRGVSAGMLATCSLPLDSRSALDTPVQHLTDAGSHRARLCECSRSARGPHRASRSAGGAARQPPAPVVAWKLELSLCRGSYT